MQEDTNGDLRPCGYISKSFNQAEKNYQIYDRELLAIIRALKAWRHYLLGPEILIRCDHKNLTYFKQSQNLTPRQARWHLYLSQFNYKIAHTPGSQMVQADALSRRSDYVGPDEDVPMTMLPAEVFVQPTEVTIQDNDLLDWIRRAGKEDDLTMEAVAIAAKKGITPAQLCLAWVCALGDKVIPIPGSS